MRIFNVGIREVILLLVIMLILFGPRQLQENARKMAQAIRRFVRSDSLRGVNRQLSGIDSDLHKTDWTGDDPVTQKEPGSAAADQDINESHGSESEQL